MENLLNRNYTSEIKIRTFDINWIPTWISISLRGRYISRFRKDPARRTSRVTARVFETIKDRKTISGR